MEKKKCKVKRVVSRRQVREYFCHGMSISAIAKWYLVPQSTIEVILRKYLRWLEEQRAKVKVGDDE